MYTQVNKRAEKDTNHANDDILDDILSRTDNPVIPHVEDLASGPEPATSPAPNLPIGDLAITCISPTKERGKGKPCMGTLPSQEPDDPHFPTEEYDHADSKGAWLVSTTKYILLIDNVWKRYLYYRTQHPYVPFGKVVVFLQSFSNKRIR